MNDLSREPRFQPAVASSASAGMSEAVLTGPGAAPPSPAAAQQAGAAEPSRTKPLTPEEQAKVIADLEALAAKQGAPGPAHKSVEEACAGAAAKALDPEAKLQREREGLKC